MSLKNEQVRIDTQIKLVRVEKRYETLFNFLRSRVTMFR